VTATSTPKLRDAVPATPSAPTPAPASPAPSAAPPVSAAPETQPLPPASTRAGGYSLARQLGLGVQRIVIDPGHGGHDPGAQANGVSEAELVLDVSKRLEALLLAQPGVEVVLTRRTNEFIPLEERTAIANREGADLFLSIHANSSPQRDTRGVETYFLNFASNPQAEVVAARENASSVQAMGGLPQLVKAITLNNKLTESRELATLVQSSLMRRLSVQNKAIKDLGVKQAPFVVLIGAQMPSVLAEISFLTNKAEASLLKQDAYRQRIAQALCDAVLKYQSSLKKVGTVAANVEAR
jgi:N-acetylmuramoyl-L-alanine amidase